MQRADGLPSYIPVMTQLLWSLATAHGMPVPADLSFYFDSRRVGLGKGKKHGKGGKKHGKGGKKHGGKKSPNVQAMVIQAAFRKYQVGARVIRSWQTSTWRVYDDHLSFCEPFSPLVARHTTMRSFRTECWCRCRQTTNMNTPQFSRLDDAPKVGASQKAYP